MWHTALWSCTHIPNKYYLIYFYLTLRSKVKDPRRSSRCATHRLMVMHLHTKYHWLISKDKKCYGPDIKMLFKKTIICLEVKCQGPTKVITVRDTPPYGHAPTYQISLTYLERQNSYGPVVYGYGQISIWGGSRGIGPLCMLDQKWRHRKTRDFSPYFFFHVLFFPYFFFPYFFSRTFFSRTFFPFLFPRTCFPPYYFPVVFFPYFFSCTFFPYFFLSYFFSCTIFFPYFFKSRDVWNPTF